MNEIAKIVSLLKDEAIEKQIAAAIVLGELKAKGPEVASALSDVLASGVPLLQRHALEALAVIGARTSVPKILPLLASNDDDVRRGATQALVSVGEDVLPMIRAAMTTATSDGKRALDGVLARLGGKDAFSALLAGLASTDAEASKAAAIAVRHKVKEADARQRKSYLAEIERFLKTQEKAAAKSPTESANAIASALKIVGYLEDEKAMPLLLSYATAKNATASVRQEAIIALRFAIGDNKSAPNVVAALLDAMESTDRTLAHTAMHTLGSLELPASLTKRLEKLVVHPDAERARFVLEQLGRQGGADAAKILVNVIVKSDRKRGEMAATVLVGNDDAVPLLAKALLEIEDTDRAWIIRNVLRGGAQNANANSKEAHVVKKIATALKKQLLDAAIDRLAKGERGWEAVLDVVRDQDPMAVLEALRALAAKLKKSKNEEKALTVQRLLCRSDRATDDDRYTLASLELAKSTNDTRPAARAGDDALRLLASLLSRGYDVATAIRKDRGLDLDQLYYLGFHFIEEGHPLGEELLGEVVKKGGRAKVARMAKNKLELADST